jgi:hypothetical protein
VHNDRMFRAVLSRTENLRAWLRERLTGQPIAFAIDWDSLEPLEQITVDGALQKHEADVAAIARMKDSPQRVLAIIEQSSGRRRGLAAQTLRYALEKVAKLEAERPHESRPAVLPFVLHTGRAQIRASMSLRAPPQTQIDDGCTGLAFSIGVDELAGKTEQQIRERNLPPMLTLAMLFAQFIDGRSKALVEEALLRWQDLFQALASPPGQVEDIEIFQTYILMTTEMTVEECTAVFGRMLNEHGVKIMKTTGQKLIELGEARGRASGEMSGQRRLLQQQLLRRFGSISTRFANALATATAEQLDAFGLRLLDAKTIEDVFAA